MGHGFFYYHRGPDGRQVRRVLLFLAVSGLLAFVLYAGAQMVRVHDVKENVRLIRMLEAIRRCQ